MAKREYMIKFRKEHDIDLQRMANVCKVSKKLLELLESDETSVTHPEIAEYIGEKYRLTKAQTEGLKPEHYRKDSPNYDPDKWRRWADETGFPF